MFSDLFIIVTAWSSFWFMRWASDFWYFLSWPQSIRKQVCVTWNTNIALSIMLQYLVCITRRTPVEMEGWGCEWEVWAAKSRSCWIRKTEEISVRLHGFTIVWAKGFQKASRRKEMLLRGLGHLSYKSQYHHIFIMWYRSWWILTQSHMCCSCL